MKMKTDNLPQTPAPQGGSAEFNPETARLHGLVHRGQADFHRGTFTSGGDNLYVNAHGAMETIHRFDVNNDGFVDIVLPNSHGYIERGPTWIYTQSGRDGKNWSRQELPNDSGWMSRVVDVDGDGYNDLVVVNGENGVTSELYSYIYWGGPRGLTGECTEIPTVGAYDVALCDLSGNGLPDLVFPSAWVDHHNLGRPRPIQVMEQVAPRKFVDVTQRYGLTGTAALSVVCEDINADGLPELVVANYRSDYEFKTDSYIYYKTPNGFDTASPLRLPTQSAMQVLLGDLNNDGWKEIVFSGGDQIYIYWSDRGAFDASRVTVLKAAGITSMFARGSLHSAVADVDGDGRNELIIATAHGVEIRSQDDLSQTRDFLPLEYCRWVSAADLNGDGRIDLVASRYEDGRFYDSTSVVFWNGPQGFDPNQVTWLETAGAMGCTSGDLNGDGVPEIIFNSTMRSWSTSNPDFPLYVYLGNERHEYSPEHRLELPTGGESNTYAIVDADLDGYPELICTTPFGLRIFTGGPDGLLADRYIDLPGLGAPMHYIAVADLNKDGWLDIVAGAYTRDYKPETMAHSSLIYWGGPDGFSLERSSPLPTYSNGQCFVADFDKDGWLDIVYGDKRGFVGIYPGGPQGYLPEKLIKIQLPGRADPLVSIPNVADLNGDGWLDIVYAVMGHYTRTQSGFYILHGGPDGFSADRMEFHPTEASSILISIADINNDGKLDLLVPAYSTQFRRDLPAYIFWGNGQDFDFEHPFVIQCDACCAFLAIDLTGNGYRDVLAICHRNDLGHQVESQLLWNGPEGLSLDHVTRLPGLGPHLSCPRDFGNIYTRKPEEYFESAPENIAGLVPTQIRWDADVPQGSGLKFQIRRAHDEQALLAAPWCGPDGEGTFYEHSGQPIASSDRNGQWIQYKAVFSSLNGCCSAKLREVAIDLSITR
jgi:hypothetical protein